MKRIYKLIQVSSLIMSLLLPNTAFADFNAILNEKFTRFSPNSQSNSGHTVVDECGGAFDGNDYEGQASAAAWFESYQVGDKSIVELVITDGRPSTLYSVWLRVKGTDLDGNDFGGNPLTNGGATPLAPGSSLDDLERISPWNNSGSVTVANGVMTNAAGDGRLVIQLDFPLHGGSYPFNKISSASLENIRNLENPIATAVPTSIVDPSDINVTAPFGLRIVSHCQDDLGHGLSPGNRETWFDWPSE